MPSDRLEHRVEILLGDAAAGIADADPEPVPRRPGHGHLDRARRVVVLHRVVQQIEQHLAEPLLVGADERGAVCRRGRGQPHATRHGQRPDQVQHVGDDRVEPHRAQRQAQRPRLDPRRVAHLIEQLHKLAAGLQRHRDPLAVPGGDVVHAEQLAEAEHGVQRGAQLMTEPVARPPGSGRSGNTSRTGRPMSASRVARLSRR
jgi:hypothetical protein